MAKKDPFGVLRVDRDIHNQLVEIAKGNGQFVSWLATRILREWLESRGIASSSQSHSQGVAVLNESQVV